MEFEGRNDHECPNNDAIHFDMLIIISVDITTWICYLLFLLRVPWQQPI